MKVQDLGSVQISRVVEIDSLPFNPKTLFGNCDLEVLRANRDWISDACVDWGSEALTLWLSFHTFIVKTRHHTILVDTCLGNHKQRPSQPAWHMLDIPFLERLQEAGVSPESIDIVFCTHLHADHVGWNTRLVDGRWVPTFPNARYIVGRREYERWLKLHNSNPPQPVNRGSFVDSVLPIAEAGLMDLVDDDHVIERELDSSVWLESAPGHSFGNVNLHARGSHGHAVMSGDVFHHPIQLARPDWYCAIDDDIAAGTRSRLSLTERFADTDTLLLTGHFRSPTAGHIVSHGDAFRFRFKHD